MPESAQRRRHDDAEVTSQGPQDSRKCVTSRTGVPLLSATPSPGGENITLEVRRTRWIDENSILEVPRMRLLEVLRTRWSYENSGLEVMGTRWIDENSSFGHESLQGGQQRLSQTPPRPHYLMILSSSE